MALTNAVLVTGTSASAVSHNTTAADFTASKLQSLAIRSSKTTAGTASTPTVTGGGRTWVQVADVLNTTATQRRLTTFRALVGTTDTSQVLTIDCGGVAHSVTYWISESDGIETSGSNGSGAVGTSATNEAGTGTTASTSQSFVSSTSGCIAATASSVSSTPEAGWTEFADVNSQLAGMFRADNDTTPTVTFGGNQVWMMVSTELIAASEGGFDPLGISGFFGI